MWGKFQQSELRIEISATENELRDSLVKVESLKKWFYPLQLKDKSKLELSSGDKFTFTLAMIEIHNEVKMINSNCYCVMLSGGIDGYQEWCWGDGWIQSRLEGISFLPLNLTQTLNLLRLRFWLTATTNRGVE